MATSEPPAPPTACQVAATLRSAATAITAAAADIESCGGLDDDALALVYNARRLTRTAQSTVNQAMCELSELLDAVNQVAGNVA